jgi:chemotaxis signal transduction protein
MDRYTGPPASFDSSHAQVLEQMSDEAFRNYARELAAIVPGAPQPPAYLKCQLRDGSCFVPLAALYEVLLPSYRLALLPTSPTWMLGLVAWRGEAIAVIDLEAYLSDRASTPQESLSDGSLLIAEHHGFPVALLVPAIELTKTTYIEQVQPPADPLPGFPYTHQEYVKGIYGDTVVLDVAVLLSDIIQQVEMAAYG